MELTKETYKNKAVLARFYTSLRQFLSKVSTEQAGVFEALSRSASPFGGNWLPVNDSTTGAKLVKTTREQSSVTCKRSRPSATPAGVSKEIGLNRFRALQAEL